MLIQLVQLPIRHVSCDVMIMNKEFVTFAWRHRGEPYKTSITIGSHTTKILTRDLIHEAEVLATTMRHSRFFMSSQTFQDG
jgi:hypothetical protein